MAGKVAQPVKEAPVAKEKEVQFGEVNVIGFDTDSGELLLSVGVGHITDISAMPISSSGKTRRLTNGGMASIGAFHGDAIPAGLRGRNLRLQVGLYADEK